MSGQSVDFNDIHVERGLDAVVRSWEGFLSSLQSPQNHSTEVRQPILGDETLSENPAIKVKSDLTLETALGRFQLLESGAEIWDAEQHRKLKKTGLRDLLGTDLFKTWLSHDDRKSVADGLVNATLRERALAARRNRLDAPWQEDFQLTDTGNIKADIANAKLVLVNDERWAGVLGYCDFSYRIMKLRKPPFAHSDVGEWTDADTDRLRIWLSENFAFTPKSADALGAVVVAAEENRFHPVRDYLQGVEWDGQRRVGHWLHSYLGADDTEYHGLVGTMWMVSAIARVMQPPVKVDSVIIFEGLQGLGKSTALSILGGDWFTDTPLVLGDKDGFQQMQGVWIIELAELDSLNKAESTRAKQFFGSQVDRFRPSYGRMVQTFSRQCVFAGTTNQESYLKDATGNRRYWPAMCTKMDARALTRDRDQLWAEAFSLYKAGARWWPQESDKHLFEAQQEDRFESDVWEELIEKWLRSHTADRVLISEIMDEALKLQAAQMKPPEQKRVGQIMAHLGWHKVRARVNGSRETGYERPQSWKGFVPDAQSQGVPDDF
ncbi:hypothetical protein G8770_03650 [Aestuariicella hydrocarbonica]|uniref:Virulence-associated protein E-like domain-containing protein n=1 Tax=Pseudomaricurvus hydrocarbonicus TaxID=1470433 RepID=A0A9E5MLU0_9GAMM|nr:virulence-associated E family protein [Aestuariicella hydrocarbonica]NHO64640.1 hypothetical protein [Aestuariicella hydrocarbonica]